MVTIILVLGIEPHNLCMLCKLFTSELPPHHHQATAIIFILWKAVLLSSKLGGK